MNDIERCQTWVSDKTLAKLAWALNLELHELFLIDDESEKSEEKNAYILFQNHKNEMLDYVEKSFETLFRDMTRN